MPTRTRATFSSWARRSLPFAWSSSLVDGLLTPDKLDQAWRRARRTIGARLALAAVRERLVAGGARDQELVLDPLGIGLPLASMRAFELHTPDLDGARSDVLDDPTRLWEHIADHLRVDDAVRARIRSELADSTFNLALALLGQAVRDVLRQRRPEDPRVCDPEHFVLEGHPWHPMCKTRLALTLRENLEYAPEHLAWAPIEALDVRADLIRGADRASEYFARLFPPPSPGWVRIPVHRGQLARLPHTVARKLGSDIRRTAIPPRNGRALLSLRTISIGDGSAPALHLKLAFGVHTTSARRTVSAMSIHNGPIVSDLLERIRARDEEARPLLVLTEVTAAGLDPRAFGSDARELGVIVRDTAVLKLPSGSATWVCAALGDRWPADRKTGIAHLCQAYEGSAVDRGRAFLRDYVARLVPPVLRFACRHGIALEAHLQNMLLVISAGRLVGFVVRDLGGIRIHRGRCSEAGHVLDLDPDSFIVTDELAEMQSKVIHCLFHAHLATVLRWVEEATGVKEAEGWSMIRQTMLAALDRWTEEPRLARAAAEDREAYLAPRMRAKALLTMRILDRSSEYSWIDVANPMSSATPLP